MRKKGQYMAVEAVLSLGLSLIVAVAAIGVFTTYQDEVMSTIQDRHATAMRSQILTAIYNLRDADSGSSIRLDLPEAENQESYRVSLDGDRLVMDIDGEERTVEVNGVSWADDLSGSATESEIQIMKLNDDILLRPE